jgi:hypothetical protein
MKRKYNLLLLGFFSLFLVMLYGCGDISGTVFNVSGSSVKVSRMTLSDNGALKIFSGGSIESIPLESIESMTLFSNDAMTINGEFCFLADIIMNNGSRKLPVDTLRGKQTQTFVPINQTIIGMSHKGSFSADLSGITKITINHKK